MARSQPQIRAAAPRTRYARLDAIHGLRSATPMATRLRRPVGVLAVWLEVGLQGGLSIAAHVVIERAYGDAGFDRAIFPRPSAPAIAKL